MLWVQNFSKEHLIMMLVWENGVVEPELGNKNFLFDEEVHREDHEVCCTSELISQSIGNAE